MSERNPVPLADSIDAMDMLKQARQRLALFASSPRDRVLLIRLREQELRHEQALGKKICASFATEDSDDAEVRWGIKEKVLQPSPGKAKVPTRRKR